MTEPASINKAEILKVCSTLKTFEKRQTDDVVRSVACRLRGNLEIAARGGNRFGFGVVLAEQVESLASLMRQEAARRD